MHDSFAYQSDADYGNRQDLMSAIESKHDEVFLFRSGIAFDRPINLFRLETTATLAGDSRIS
jgi:hypothetical protein